MSNFESRNPEESPLPCPFCDFVPTPAPDGSAWTVECGNRECRVDVRVCDWKREDAIANWNRRTTSSREAYDDLLRALKRAREALYNGFEPDNQSRAYHDVDDAIRKSSAARLMPLETEKQIWQPMETAPRDGTEVLLQVEYRSGIPGKCLVGHYMPGGHCIEDHPAIDSGWYFWNGCMFDRASKPMRWMPLPKVPTDGERGQSK